MKKYRKGIFVVVHSKTKNKVEYLILKRKLHWRGWEFPKGGKKFFETAKMTAKREIKEETGLKILEIKKFKETGKYEYEKSFPNRKNFLGQTYNLYSVKVKKKKIILDKLEHSDFRWVKYKDALKKLTWNNQKDCLKIINRCLNK